MIKKTRGWADCRFAIAAVFAAIIAFSFGASPALAQDGQAAPAASTENEVPPGKWMKRCTKRGETDYCETSFGRLLNVADKEIWLSRAGVLQQGDNRDFFVFVPLGAALSRGLAFRVDTGEPQPAKYSFCLQVQGCQAIAPASDALIDQLKRGGELQVQFTMANRPPLITKVSLSGFTAAYDGPPTDLTADAGAAAGDGGAAAAGGKGDAPAQ